MESTSIKYWLEDDQPRKKLLQSGPSSLSQSELLALIINHGTRNRSALQLAKELLQSCQNDLNKLGGMDPRDICHFKIKGLGEAKAIGICAALELGLRRNMVQAQQTVIRSAADIHHFLVSKLGHRRQEVFAVVFLNSANRLIDFEIVSEGGINTTVADPRVILRKALVHEAVALIVSHNHPSGQTRPSEQDLRLTRRLKEAAALLDIRLLDHIIVGQQGYCSLAEEGLL